MKKLIFSIFIVINSLYTHTISCCPFQFCPEDQRPFFEQYTDKGASFSPILHSVPNGDPNEEKQSWGLNGDPKEEKTILKIKKEES